MSDEIRKMCSPHNKGLKVGEWVRYTLDREHDQVERIGTVLLLDGRHCVVELKNGGLVWITLSAS